MIKSNLICARWVAHKLEETSQKVFHRIESSKPDVRLLSLGGQQWENEYPVNLALKAKGV